MKATIEQLFQMQDQSIIYNALPRTLKPGYTFGPHSHENVEICLMKEGECDIIINGESVTVRKGELLIIFSHMIHSFHVNSNRPAVFLQIHFCPESLTNINPRVNEGLTFLHYMTDQHSAYIYQPFTDQLLSCVERICQEMNNDTEMFHISLANIYIYELLFLLSREIEKSVRRKFNVDNPIVIRAIHYINQNIEYPLTLDEISQSCNVTTRYLSKIFKSYMNITVNEYILIAKIELAMNYICNSNLTVTTISSKLGFSSGQYFATVFKKYTGVTPREFKTLRNKDI